MIWSLVISRESAKPPDENAIRHFINRSGTADVFNPGRIIQGFPEIGRETIIGNFLIACTEQQEQKGSI